MSTFAYTAVDLRGLESRGTLEVSDQGEALKRIKEMGLFPVRVAERRPLIRRLVSSASTAVGKSRSRLRLGGRVKSRSLAVFTRQLGTLLDAGMPLLRGLRLLAEQEEGRNFKRIISEVAEGIETGSSLAEALSWHPRAFDSLYINMVRAGELSGALEATLLRLAEFREKAQRIKAKVKAAMVYPCAVLAVASGVLMLLMVYVVPRFKSILDGLTGRPLPVFTLFVFRLSDGFRSHFLTALAVAAALGAFLVWVRQTRWGREVIDRLKLALPVIGVVFRKATIARFSRTLGTLLGSGVPILQALNIVKETTGNVVIGRVVAKVHDQVKEGEAIAPTLRAPGVFPVMVAGMVDVGEQTGALPELLLKVADTYDEEVDTAVGAMTSLLEPVLIVFLAVVVGAIVIAIFLPLVNVDPSRPAEDA